MYTNTHKKTPLEIHFISSGNKTIYCIFNMRCIVCSIFILSTPSFRREVKPFVPCRRFTECKRSLNVTWKSGIFRQNASAISRPSSSSFHYYGLWWRHLAMQVGATTDQGLYNKPSAAVHLGALATGTLPQYNTIQCSIFHKMPLISYIYHFLLK